MKTSYIHEAAYAAAMTAATATAGWTWLAEATAVVQLLGAVVVAVVGIMTARYYWHKTQEIKRNASRTTQKDTSHEDTQ